MVISELEFRIIVTFLGGIDYSLFGGVLKSMLAIKINKKPMLSFLILQPFQGFKNCSNFNQHTF